jgi:hypothetical protein
VSDFAACVHCLLEQDPVVLPQKLILQALIEAEATEVSGNAECPSRRAARRVGGHRSATNRRARLAPAGPGVTFTG